MNPSSVARRSHVDLGRTGFGIGDELGNGSSWHRWIDLHDVCGANGASDRRDVADEIEVELIVKLRVDLIRHADRYKRIAVTRRTHGRLGADISASSRPVLDDEWLAKPFRQPLTYQAR